MAKKKVSAGTRKPTKKKVTKKRPAKKTSVKATKKKTTERSTSDGTRKKRKAPGLKLTAKDRELQRRFPNLKITSEKNPNWGSSGKLNPNRKQRKKPTKAQENVKFRMEPHEDNFASKEKKIQQRSNQARKNRKGRRLTDKEIRDGNQRDIKYFEINGQRVRQADIFTQKNKLRKNVIAVMRDGTRFYVHPDKDGRRGLVKAEER